MSQGKILIVDDEEDILELISYNLSREGYQVIPVSSGEDALKKAGSESPDLIILDLMLPGLDGLETCKLLKNSKEIGQTPIIMLTAKGEEADIVTGLELGADDYITKPFSPRVLIARVKAVLRRRDEKPSRTKEVFIINDLYIHTGRHEVKVKDKTIDLTSTEFRLLCFLAKKPGWVFTRYQIVDALRGKDYYVTDRSIDVQIVGLRKKLGSAGNYIETVRGVGYRFKDV